MQPSRLLLYLLLALLALSIAAIPWPDALNEPWRIALLLLMSAVALDAILIWRAPQTMQAERHLAGVIPVGVESTVTLTLRQTGTLPVRVTLFDHYPVELHCEDFPITLRLAGRQGSSLQYRIRANQRGSFQFGRVEAQVGSPLGLWRRTIWLGAEQSIRVYPNFAKVSGYALLATANRLSLLGVLQRRRRGEGLEFHQLREYREGDSQRQIDWKATARMRKLISREYQDERDQQVMFLLDCGRRMAAQDGELSHFDHALNALLLLGHVALRQGDAVGLMTFASDTPRFVAPRKAKSTTSLLMDTLFDLQPGKLSPDYLRAALDLTTQVKRRALVIVVTSLRDEDSDSLLPALKLLRERHLVVMASLREEALDLSRQTVDTLEQALQFAATVDYNQRRAHALRQLTASGARCLDVEPAQLPLSLVNRYLELKQSHAL
ncbi:DUF58 domain-containing protein [Chitinivorax tropicus]|uniref:DUF58 domain-containing protein n=1 Tax=Chitinivorax tropicus TaxID=714531 RepID=UPI00161EFFAF|nr:DUF58 domain-containing protein [Chitinivorax tropicus]